MPRRKPGTLLSLELDVLEAGLRLQGDERFYGFALARELAANAADASLVAHGTLYKALARMTAAGLLDAEWEDAELAAADGRPRRRLYRVTGAGAEAAAAERTRLRSVPNAARAAFS